MKCYNHPEVDAVAVCKSCSRGLCRECAVEVGTSIGCKNRCEADVAALDEIIRRGRTGYQKTSSTYFRSGLVIILLGAVFLFMGVASWGGGQANYFFLVTGGLIAALGISYFVSARHFGQK